MNERADEALRLSALAVSGAEGETLFHDLARDLSAILGVEVAFIATFADRERTRMRTLAVAVDGEIRPGFDYPLAGTPCADVVGRAFRFHGAGVQGKFPRDDLFVALGVEGYAAYPLNGAAGQPLGIIGVMSRRPLADAALAESVLRIFAGRAAAEIGRGRAEQARRVSEASYRAIFEATEDAIFVHDWDTGAILDVNPKACEAYGYSPEEFRRLTPVDLGSGVPPYTQEEAARRLGEARAGGPVRFEWQRRNKDGSLHWDEVTLKKVEIGGRPYLLAITREITERRLAEERLRASEEQYRAIFNASADALVLWNSSLQRVEVNPAYERLLGYSRAEVLGDAYESAHSREYAERRRALVRRTLAGERCHAELEAERKNGERFQIEVRTIPVTYRGEPHVLAILRDISERKRAEERLRASEEQYRAMFDAAADALVLRDADFRIVDVNPAYLAMSGYRRDEVIGVDRLTLNPDELRDYVLEMHRRALAGEPIQFEATAYSRNGRCGELEVRGVPILHQGKPHVLYIGRDITARKRAEAERAALEAQLRQAQKMEAIGHLAGGIAHDFNNLLTSIMGYIVLASERPAAAGDAKLARYLDQSQQSCRRARDLIQQLLTFSRGRRGEPRPVDLAAHVRAAEALLRSALPATLELDVAFAPGTPPVLIDPVHADQILLNLCINARDATGGRGSVRVSVGRARHAGALCTACRKPFAGEFVELCVRDDGAGIAPGTLDRMFEPFFTTKAAGEGSGMGLATVHGIVHEHGGHILVETAPGRGATFRILLPASGGPVAQAAEAPAAPASRGALAGRVLLVDDEASVSGFLRELLESWGLEVVACSDGLEAREAFASEPAAFALVLTDQTMPRLTGTQLARELTRLRPDVPVILCSGYADTLGRAEAEAAGIRAFVHKPIDPAELRAILEGHLPRAPAA